MKKIAILGNSLSAIKVVEHLKAHDQDIEAVIISQENTFPYYRNRVSQLPVKKINSNQLFYRANAEYLDEKITFIFEKKVTRVNFKRRRLTLDDKEQIDYDVLLLADLSQQPFFGVKGANKSGLYNLKKLADTTTVLKLIPLIETIVIQSDHLAGLKMAIAFSEIQKEVILVTLGKNILNGLLSETDALALEVLLQESGVRVMTDSQIVEILGDTDAKAVRLQNGKVFGCQAVLTDADLPDLRLFKETELQSSQRVSVNESYQTNFDNVFALDAVCANMKFTDWDVSENFSSLAEEQGKIIAARIVNKEYSPVAQTLVWDLELKGELVKISVENDAFGNPILKVVRTETAVSA
ncbi:MAG: FAD-dependent oxidoreductase [Candidatus Omnitrophica bacterium]|nr:FAD-dependent oxidoreductase [Candidatus Omnitrophota bacterium]